MEPLRVFQLAGALCKREFLAAASVTQKGSHRCIFLCKPRCWLCFRGDKFSHFLVLRFGEAKVIRVITFFRIIFQPSPRFSIIIINEFFEFDKKSISQKKKKKNLEEIEKVINKNCRKKAKAEIRIMEI